jgi:small-conductance mechanosensitive channel
LQKVAHQERTKLPHSSWYAAVASSKVKYTALIDALKAQGVADPSEYGKLVQERQRLETESARLDSLQKQRQQLSEQTQTQLQGVLSARRALRHRQEITFTTSVEAFEVAS